MIRNWLTRWLADKFPAETLVNRRDPDFLIGGRDDPYLRRWWLIPRNPIFNVYLHQMLRDDDDRAPHCHPWLSVSLMLRGRLKEIYLDRNGDEHSRMIEEGTLVFRGARFRHRLVVPQPGGDDPFHHRAARSQLGFLV